MIVTRTQPQGAFEQRFARITWYLNGLLGG